MSREDKFALRARSTKRITFLSAADPSFDGVRVPVNLRKYRTLDALLDDLSRRVPRLFFGCRRLTTAGGKHQLTALDQLEDHGQYFCTDSQRSRALPPPPPKVSGELRAELVRLHAAGVDVAAQLEELRAQGVDVAAQLPPDLVQEALAPRRHSTGSLVRPFTSDQIPDIVLEEPRALDGRPRSTKNIYFFSRSDPNFNGVKMPVNVRKYRTLDALLDDLSLKVPRLFFGCRRVETAKGKHQITALHQLQHLGKYFCTDSLRSSRLPPPPTQLDASMKAELAALQAAGADPAEQLQLLVEAGVDVALIPDHLIRYSPATLSPPPEPTPEPVVRLGFAPAQFQAYIPRK